MATHVSTLGRAHLGFADSADVTRFVETLERYERGEMDADAWRAFRLVQGTYGQRQEGTLAMLRAKIPQGVLTAPQLEKLADVSDRYSRGFAHITTRQNFQLHFLELSQVGAAMQDLADVGITTREACGNAVRTITTSPSAGVAADEAFDATPYAEALTRFLLRHPLASGLPRKFKMAFTGGGKDHAFAAINDVGWHAARENGEPAGRRGFRVTVGGGTALWSQNGKELFAFLPAGDIFLVVESLLRVFNARGDREHRKKNRMKFLIKQMGWDAFQAAVHEQLALLRADGEARALPFDPESPPEEVAPPSPRATVELRELDTLLAKDAPHGPGLVPSFLPTIGDPRGERFFRTNVQPQKQAGYSAVTVTVPLGDLSSGRLRALAWIALAFGDGQVRTTPGQNLLLRWVRSERVADLYEALKRAGLSDPDPESLGDVTSCPGAESCKLAVTQPRGLARVLNESVQNERALLDSAPLVVKVSGCPNGCGLHHVAGLGFQGGLRKIDGRPVPQYHVLVGGSGGGPNGEAARFGRLIAKIPARKVAAATRRLIALYKSQGDGTESMTDFLARAPLPTLKAAVADLEKMDEKDATAEDFIDLGETQAFAPETTEGECIA
jgi:sulfite reductase beta subunit-like hemoprotein